VADRSCLHRHPVPHAAQDSPDGFAALETIAPERITDALSSLVSAGVVQLGTGGVRATRAVQRLDELGLIAL
jgi:hypothetical protein